MGVICPWDGRHFSRVTSGVRFCVVGRALWSCPATRAVLCVGRFLRGYLADKYVGRLSLGSALCPPPPPCSCFFLGWRAVHGITNNLAGRPLGRGFVLWAVLCGHAPLPERFCVWAAFCGAVLLTTLWSALPPPFAYALFFQVFSSLFHFESPNFGRNR